MPDYLEQLRAELLKLGCPITPVRRLVREVADHREDLKQAGLAEGLSEADAESRAESSLGDPQALAEQMMTTVRRSSWWGRHYVVTCIVLPLLAWPVLWGLLIVSEVLLVFWLGYGWDPKKFLAAIHNPIAYHHILQGAQLADFFGVTQLTLLFYWLARRGAVKLKWMLICSVICCLMAVIFWPKFEVFAGGLTFIGAGALPIGLRCFRGAIPLIVIGATYAIQQWRVRRFQREAQLD